MAAKDKRVDRVASTTSSTRGQRDADAGVRHTLDGPTVPQKILRGPQRRRSRRGRSSESTRTPGAPAGTPGKRGRRERATRVRLAQGLAIHCPLLQVHAGTMVLLIGVVISVRAAGTILVIEDTVHTERVPALMAPQRGQASTVAATTRHRLSKGDKVELDDLAPRACRRVKLRDRVIYVARQKLVEAQL